ncbi:MAG: M20/M25/M40 family metallo-hydrolase [Myxococcales bacterium]|nr:M20/M25/M40 family metallo-hydrolase [Myxococcales bacterium]
MQVIDSAPRVAVALALALAACGAEDGGEGPPEPEPALCDALGEAIDGAALESHMIAFAEIADANAGTRAVATPGYARSAEHAVATLEAAGYQVERQVFEYPDYELVGPPDLALAGPEPRSYLFYEEFRVARNSGSAALEAPLTPIAIVPGLGNASTSGCAIEDFAGLAPGAIAVVQRGTCSFNDKAENAAAAGAGAMILFNQGDSEERKGVFSLRVDAGTTIPVVSVGYEIGLSLAEAGAAGHLGRIQVAGREVDRQTENVLVETPATASGRVIMIGAHLDSVPAGPGINDNGSGSAAVLELAAQLQRCAPEHQVRLALWGAEELGLYGSYYYVATLPEEAQAKIALYLNLDMIASPNSARAVYDGDGSAFGEPGPEGSAAIEAALAGYYAGLGLESGETAFDGRSDYGPFITVGIPAGGIFTGAEGSKSAHEAARFGGEADAAYDPCYHQACDDLQNYDREELWINARAAAQVIGDFASGTLPLPPPVTPRAARPSPRPPAAAHDGAVDSHSHPPCGDASE